MQIQSISSTVNPNNFQQLPKTHSPAKSFKTSFTALACSKTAIKISNRIWSVLCCIVKGVGQLINKIMKCFQSIFLPKTPLKTKPFVNKKSKSAQQLDENFENIKPIKKSVKTANVQKKEDLCQIFNQSLNYEKFHDSILSYKINFYNNYYLESYHTLKNSDASKFDKYTNKQQKQMKAGIAVYDAIVELYMQRILHRNPELNDELYLSSLKVIALGIAIKNSWDEAIYNNSLQQFIVPNIGVKKYGKMEVEFLKGIDWNLSLTDIQK